ncbi:MULTISPECIES: McrB family protein [unclassified Phyllobacterium]|uniref:McrB family protein n=1 Tax=unclassified Phyllobacterium TaxID=2638441 RepID=UPI003012CD57
MDIRERQQQYKDAVQAFPGMTKWTRVADAFGVSNSAKIIGGALFAFNINLASYSAAYDQIAVHCLLRFPPEDEIYFTIFVKNDLPVLEARLEEMRGSGSSKPRNSGQKSAADEDEPVEESIANEEPVAATAPDTLDYTDNNKNVKGYIASDGRLYLRNKGYWDTMPADLSTISKPVAIDRIVFAIWPPAASASRGLMARELIGYLGNLIGREKIHELRVWADMDAVSADMQRMPASLSLKEIEDAIAAAGGHYPDGEISRFHGAMNFLSSKHFVILSGLSGTGKTRLAIQYAHAVHGLSGKESRDPFLFICPVRPEWTDPTGLTGYYDVLSNRYIIPPFLEAVLLATAHRDSPVFVVLDEMNLARVEYYLSDVLSAMESGEKIRLHSSGVPLEGSNGTPVPAALELPSNLYIAGTINVDETTNSVSDKVLDRAIVIDMSSVDLPGFFDALMKREPSLTDARAACEEVLGQARTILAAHGLGFGYRVAEEVVRYHTFAEKHLNPAPNSVIDDLMVQKILVKLRGGERQRPMLAGLTKALAGLPRSQNFLTKLLSDLDEYGAFQANR